MKLSFPLGLQVGGFMQVGAHGTGAGIPPVDNMVRL
jgi:hypothetical protein